MDGENSLDLEKIRQIEKIKQQEKEEELKLKEKREYDCAVAALNKAIRDVTNKTEKSKLEQKTLIEKIDRLNTTLVVEIIQRDALSAQLEALKKELEEITNKYNESLTKLWTQRSSFIRQIHSTSDNYDVWALLMKPTCVKNEIIIRNNKTEPNNPLMDCENRLQAAIERRSKALAEREYLQGELHNGGEYIRIKNALQYCLEKIEELKK